MIRFVTGALAVGLLATPAFAIAPNCADQLAEIKSQMTSEMLAQSALGNKYEEADRLCKSGNDLRAQSLAREIREQMAAKANGAHESTGSSVMPQAGKKQQ
jgi:hypothetical protein